MVDWARKLTFPPQVRDSPPRRWCKLPTPAPFYFTTARPEMHYCRAPVVANNVENDGAEQAETS